MEVHRLRFDPRPILHWLGYLGRKLGQAARRRIETTYTWEHVVTQGHFVSFTTPGLTDKVLRGPYDSMRLRFNTPAYWELTEGATLRLDIEAHFTSTAPHVDTEAQGTGAALEVTFDDQLISTVFSGAKKAQASLDGVIVTQSLP